MKFLSEFFNSGTVKQQNKKRFGALLICATAILLAIALIVLMIASIATAIKNKAPSETPEDSGGIKIPSGYTTTTFDAAQLNAGNLLLIDTDHPYKGTPATVLFRDSATRPKTTDGSVVYSIGGTDRLAATSETVEAFNAMITAFYADAEVGGDDCLYIAAAYDQTAVNQANQLYAAGTALALTYYVDYTTDPTNRQTIYGVEKYEWIYENAADYGFIQVSTAEGEENIFRYVGVAHATYITENEKTFAEYLTLLQGRTYSTPLSITVKNSEGKNVGYGVYYLSASDTLVVPTKYNYTVSGDNMGGYIITYDKASTTK